MNTYKVSAAYEYEPHTWKHEEFIVRAPTSYLAGRMVKNDLSNKYSRAKILYVQKVKHLSAAAQSVLWVNAVP